MTPTQIQDRLRSALNELPDTPSGIAHALAEKGIKGVPYHACACPIARYLRREAKLPIVYVSDTLALGYGGSGQGATWPLPEAVATFVEDFDSGQYKELEDPNGLTREERWEVEDGGYEPL